MPYYRAGSPSRTGVEDLEPLVWFLWNLVTGARPRFGPAHGTRSRHQLAANWGGVASLALVVWATVPAMVSHWQATGEVEPPSAAQLGAPAGALWACVAAALFGCGWVACRWLMDLPFRRQWLLPAHEVLMPILGWPEGTKPEAYLRVTPEFAAAPGGVRLRIPRERVPVGNKRKEIDTAMRSKLPLGNVPAGGEQWALKGRQHMLVYREPTPERLPDLVAYSDPHWRNVVAKAEVGKPFLGALANGRPFGIDFADETPHCLFSAGTGAGKSSGVKAIVAQEMHHGAGVIILDLKRRSQKAFKGIPGVIYCRRVEHMHSTLVQLGKEISRRSEAAELLPDDEELNAPRILLVCEELNATMKRLRGYWKEIRDRDDPVESPAVRAYSDALLMGRAERVHVLAIAQMGTAAALGGGDAREQYGFRALSRFSEQARKMLIPNVSKARSSTHRGRWVVGRGEEAFDVQFLWMTDAEARTMATSGKRSVLPFQVTDLRDEAIAEERRRLTVVRDEADRLVTLRQASNDFGEALVDRSLASLRADRHRWKADGFPAAAGKRGNADVFDRRQLTDFYAGRTAADLVEASA